MKEKYIELLLKGCLKMKASTPLLINYNKINKDFVNKLVEYANQIGVKDIYLDENDSYYIHDLLNELSLQEIKTHKAFDCRVWDEYAKKDAAFLMLESEIPNLMSDIPAEKVEAAAAAKRDSKPIYKERQLKSEISWCIACIPNEEWAKDLFPEHKDPIKKFWHVIEKICMLDDDDPIKSWKDFSQSQKMMQTKLNSLKIKKLHYTNDLGTDLEICLSDQALWENASSGKWIVNMPSYEVFTTPIYNKTNGIVYSSKPLIYNGQVIDKFYLKFENGKVIEHKAQKGNEILQEIIKGDGMSAYLGEAALVNYDSPISNTGLVFKSTLIDENASCHLALGSGFIECVQGGNDMSKTELKKLGVNDSKNHVDFMIGTKDLKIEAETDNGNVIIMENGNIVL